MTPRAEIRVDGAPAPAVMDRLLSLRATDEAGLEADLLEITLDARDGIAPPRRGVEITLALGFAETGLTVIGAYRVTAVSGAGPARTLTIVARSAALDGPIRDPRTRDWRDVSLGGIVREIAARHGLAARIAPVFDAPPIPHVEQAEESDLNLMTRLAQDAGALVTVKGGALILLEEGAGRTAGGDALPQTRVTAAEAADWSWTVEDRETYGQVRAFWRDLGAAEKRAATVGEDGPVFELRRVYASEGDARRAARARLRRFRRATATVRVRLSTLAAAAGADAPLTLEGFDAGADGTWRIARVEHRLGPEGLSTVLEAERHDREQDR